MHPFNEDSPDWPAYSKTIVCPQSAEVPTLRLDELLSNSYDEHDDYQATSPMPPSGGTEGAAGHYVTSLMVIGLGWTVAVIACLLGLGSTNPDAVIPAIRTSSIIAGLSAWFVSAFHLRHRYPMGSHAMMMVGSTLATVWIMR